MDQPIGQYDVVHALTRHIGRETGVHIADLVREITGLPSTPGDERRVRKIIAELREEEGQQICGRPETGYFIARTAEELDEFSEFLFDRAMSTLRKVYRMRRIAMPDLRGQLKLPT